MPTLHRDYETRSELELGKVGAWQYATHPSTAVLCCAYAVDDDAIQLWVPGDPIPEEFIAAAHNLDWVVSAFNDGFERQIERHIMAPRYDWPVIPIEQHRCSQAAALALALPAALENVAQSLSLSEQKDNAGHNAMLQLARPRKPHKGEDPKGVYWYDDLERREKLYQYCMQDVATERALHHRIGFLSPELQAEWVLDAAINDRGMYLDGGLLDAAIRIAKAAPIEINNELHKITGGELDTINQPKLKDWLGAHGCEVANIQKATLRKALTRSNVPAVARRAIELRLDGAHAAAAKLVTMRKWRSADGRARGAFRFHGASTGRWTSFGIQVQNLKRPTVADLGAAIDAVATGDLNHLRQRYEQPMSAVGDIARALICAQPGHRFIAADFSGIESRVTAWVSGQQSKVDQWAKFDRMQDPHDEPYFIVGHENFRLPENQARGTGKTGDLAFGFGGGIPAYRKLAPPDDTSTDAEIEQRKAAWRTAHPETVNFWYTLDRAAKAAVRKPDTIVPCKRVSFECRDAFLFMHLPSGRSLAYPFPRLKINDRGDRVVAFMDASGGKWVECRYGQGMWGGVWTENVVSAIARDVFAAAMPRLEAAGYPIVLHVHDEIVAEVPDGVGSAEEFLRIITAAPAWADGLPIAAKVRNGPRFCKIEAPKAAPAEPECDATETVSTQPLDGFSRDAEVANAVNERTGEAPTGSKSEHNPPPPPPNEEPDSDDPPPQGNGRSNRFAADSDSSAGAHTRHSSDGNVHGDSGPKHGRRTAQWFYPHPDQPNYLRVDRCDNGERKFYQHHWDGKRWVHGVKGTYAELKIPYRLPELKAALRANPNVEVQLCEGESDADALVRLGFVVTTNPGGALSWTPELTSWLRILGVRRAVIHEDNDDKGRKRSVLLTAALSDFIKLKIVRYPDVPEGQDVRWWLEHGHHTKEELEARIAGAGSAAELPFPFINMSNWDSEPVPEQEWTVFGRIPRRQSVIFSGEGGAGKSVIQLHLSAAAVLGRDWLGATPEQGPAFFIDCEDDQNVMHYRLAAIARHYNTCFTDLIRAGLHLTSLVGQDTVLATVSRSGVVEPTTLYNRLLQAAGDIKPTMIGIAASANVFAGDENNRSQVQQFINLTTRLAIVANGALALITHPSLTGITTGSGLSGTTQWHNAVRARFFLKSPKAEPGEQPDNDLREIEFKKNQYGAMAENIPLRWQDGMFLPIDGGTLDRAEKEARADEVFLDLLRRFTTENRYVSNNVGSTYAPAVFAREDRARKAGINNASLANAMRRLFEAGKIYNADHGRPSRPRYHIAVKVS